MTLFREAVVDLGAIAENYRVLRERVGVPALAVVKADAYGHGAVPVAKTLEAAGADALGTADLDEALALRAAGIAAPILCWLHGPDTDFAPAVANRIEVAVSSVEQLERLARAARAAAASDVPCT